MPIAHALFEQALALTPLERVHFAIRLVESVDYAVVDNDAESAWASELTARIQAVNSGRADIVSADEALQSIRSGLAARRA